MTVDALTFAVDTLAAYRLTRLVNRDTLPPVARARAWLVARFGDDSYVAELVECPWCAGFWIALGVVAARYLVATPWTFAALVFALSALVGLISERD